MNNLEQFRADQYDAIRLLNSRVYEAKKRGEPLEYEFNRRPTFKIDENDDIVTFGRLIKRAPKLVGPVPVRAVLGVPLEFETDFFGVRVYVDPEPVTYGYDLAAKRIDDRLILNGLAVTAGLGADLFKSFGE